MRLLRSCRTFLVVLALGLAPDVVAGQQIARAEIRGFVRDSLGFPITGASVMVSPGVRITRVDSAGHFILRDLAPGSLQLRVRQLGFAPADTIVHVDSGGAVDLDLVMERLPPILDTVVVQATMQCARFTLEGLLCRRGTAVGLFLNQEEIRAKKPVFPGDVLRDAPGFRPVVIRRPHTLGRDVESLHTSHLLDE
jgi:Carboxypeptidase regulatory-like domain